MSVENTNSFLNGLQSKVSLKYLNLSGLTINNQTSADYLSSAIASMNELEELSVRDCAFENNVFFEFNFDALKHSTNLRKLSFVSTNLNYRSAWALSKVIKNLPNLSEINLKNNNIELRGAFLITWELGKRTNIDYLNFAHNNIDGDNIIVEMKVIKSNKLKRHYGTLTYNYSDTAYYHSNFDLLGFQSDNYPGSLLQEEIGT